MNCQRFEDVIDDIARDQKLDAGARGDALSHAAGCERCAERLEDERAMTLHLRGLAENTKSVGAPGRVEARLWAAFDELALTQSPTPPPALRQYRARYFIGAIAAGLLMVFGLFAIRWPVALRQATGTPSIAAVQSPATSQVIAKSAPPIIVQSPAPSPVSRRRSSASHKTGAPAKSEPVRSVNTEIATDFLPLTYGAATNLEEGGRMVRVELPHSAMATFGLPVNIDRADERVKADVLLGVDGLAHAIRFVR